MSQLDRIYHLEPHEISLMREKVINYFNKKKWGFEILEDGFYRIIFVGLPCFPITIQVGTGVLFVKCELPFEIPEFKRSNVNRFINMANYNISYGHFSIDLFYGFVYYKYTVQFAFEDISFNYIDTAIVGSFSYMGQFISSFEAIVKNGLSPTKALKMALFT